MEGLNTSTNGIDNSTMADRKLAFGDNKTASRPPKTFCQLCLEALDDVTM
jgi:hypothetical protein